MRVGEGVLEMERRYAFNPKKLAGALGIDDWEDLLAASDHPYGCRCEKCREWWRRMGPDPDTGQFGPFTKDEIDEAGE